MFCQECGALIPDGATFCDDCTRRVAGVADQQPYFAPGDAFAAPPGGAAWPPPAIADYQKQQSQWAYPYPRVALTGQATHSRASGSRNSLAAISISGGCGLMVAVSTFLPWISFGGLFNASGWSWMVNPSQLGSGNFLWYSAPGFLFFTGFFSLLLGLAVIAGAALFLFSGMFFGARTAQVAGGLGALVALINLITLYTHVGGSGIGLWVFLVFSIGAAIAGELCIKSIT